jgi:hypothetical protein
VAMDGEGADSGAQPATSAVRIIVLVEQT